MADTINLSITENNETVNLTISEFLSTGTGALSWGGITGTLSDQTDLQSALDGKANLVHTHVEADITDLDKYTQTEVNSLINPLKSTVVNQTVSGTFNLDLLNDTFYITMTGATTFTFSNLPPNVNADKRTFTLWLTGSQTFSFSGILDLKFKGSADYDGTIWNVIVIEVIDSTASAEIVKLTLNPHV